MADNDDYVEAARDAKRALHGFLMMCEPDTGHALRLAYRELKQVVKGQQAQDAAEVGETDVQREVREHLERRDAWRRISRERREAYVFQWLKDDRLTIGELTERAVPELEPDCVIYETDIRAVVNRMYKAGHLEREGEAWRSRIRYRYFRKRTLEGPIADLQVAFEQDDQDEKGEGA